MISIAPITEGGAFTGRPMQWVVSSDTFIQSAGAYSIDTIKFNTTPTNGQTLILDILGGPITFTFKTSPALNGAELPLSASAATLLPYISANAALYLNYKITVFSSDTLKFTAREQSDDSALAISGTYSGAALTAVKIGRAHV